ncbi:heterodisulfide reductase-related iron-sulfur binding cluster [Bradyrhizobium oligotrophicum]|uniref:heterodisulfide reductase-related iron-sulfur binding cluster n=1 Tax=Bradyrhizobium oligotrophicum TaxID=44255 RepID=UPI003EBC747D
MIGDRRGRPGESGSGLAHSVVEGDTNISTSTTLLASRPACVTVRHQPAHQRTAMRILSNRLACELLPPRRASRCCGAVHINVDAHSGSEVIAIAGLRLRLATP